MRSIIFRYACRVYIYIYIYVVYIYIYIHIHVVCVYIYTHTHTHTHTGTRCSNPNHVTEEANNTFRQNGHSLKCTHTYSNEREKIKIITYQQNSVQVCDTELYRNR
jgi:hypothetical protein